MGSSFLGSVLRRGFQLLRRQIPTQGVAVLSMAVALTLAGSAYALHLQLNRLAVRLNQELRIVVFLKPGQIKAHRALAEKISALEGVQGVILIGSEEAKERLGEMLGPKAGLLEGLGPEVVPTVLEVELTPGGREGDGPVRIAAGIEEFNGVDEAVYAGDVAQRLESFLARFKSLGRALSVCLVLGGMFIVYATIRLVFLGRQEEIYILRLIGARGWFIRGPYLVQGVGLGLAAGGLSLLFLKGLELWLGRVPHHRPGSGPLWFLGELRIVEPDLVGILLLAGAAAGLAGAWLALGRVMGER